MRRALPIANLVKHRLHVCCWWTCLTLCSQGGIWASVATEGADSHRSPATGRAVGREDLADGRTARILSPPQDHLLRGGQRWVKCLILSRSLYCVSVQTLTCWTRGCRREETPPRAPAQWMDPGLRTVKFNSPDCSQVRKLRILFSHDANFNFPFFADSRCIAFVRQTPNVRLYTRGTFA